MVSELARFRSSMETPRVDGQAPKTSSDSVIEPSRRRDPYYIHPSDNPGAPIVVNLLTLSNYLLWSRSIRLALKTKNKLGFIDGSCLPPKGTLSDDYMRWSDADSLVTGWILHSMTKDLMEAYMFTSPARQLWLELEEKFGVSDKSVIFRLDKQLIQTVQGNDSLALYSNKQKKLLDELNCLSPKSPCICNGCTCGGYKKLHDKVESNDIMTFLYGLNESYDSIVSTVLLMDPMPSYNKVYSLVAKIELQRRIRSASVSHIEANTLAVKASEAGHLEEACFKKHGFPEWFTEKKKLQQNPVLAVAGNSNTEAESSSTAMDPSKFSQMIQLEIQKYLKGQKATLESPVNTSYFADFAGNLSFSKSKLVDYTDKWVIDSGASSHVTGNVNLLKDLREITGLNTVTLPDGSVKHVKSVGTAILSDKLKLDNVLFVPDFRYNLISVSKMVTDLRVEVKFCSSGCVMQDQLSNQVIAEGRLERNLFVLSRSFNVILNSVALNNVDRQVALSSTKNKVDIWHNRMGHPSTKVRLKLPFSPKDYVDKSVLTFRCTIYAYYC
ncbi:Retrovirus-related Pol polyprotein from transposon TNT 1-94 [Senna tora]|uniref:Retrovirus-related Pol polyprotein from transposon TNT 1-94 n=1 Tax=Senna tora TaxID=362788 RepID=A0A834W9F9_9FABA|nr:Retrovirus-related Pol polyprotein from transposon TNT 1-94 [Senna tora]